jgi:hypothetical protein
VSGGHLWSTLTSGNFVTCGVTTAGAGYCWGQDGNGELGDGAWSNENTPFAVSGGYVWSEISEGANTTCGVTTSGTGYCWGYNDGGEVGDNTLTDRNVPTALPGGYTWSVIDGSYTSCGLTTVGVPYCWGWNGDGSVGDNSTSQRHVPTAVSGGLTFSSIANGMQSRDGNTNCGLQSDGILYCWGWNDAGQVGNGNTTSQHVPVEVTALYASNNTTTVTGTVDPAFMFSVANLGSPCNGESNFAGSAGAASSVTFGHLALSTNTSGGQALSVSSNAGGGFVVYLDGAQSSQNFRSAGHNWGDVSGSYASPAVLGSGEVFGYTYHDSTTSSSVTNPASANFIALTNINRGIMGSTSSETGSSCVSYDVQTSGATPAGTYSATVTYTAVPTF